MSTPLFRQILGSDFDRLPAVIQNAHRATNGQTLSSKGVCTIRRGNFLTNIMATVAGMPSAGENVPVTLTVTGHPDGETWKRQFGNTVLTTRQVWKNGELLEFMGPGALVLRCQGNETCLTLHSCGLKVFGLIPVPAALSPSVNAEERVLDGKLHFNVEIAAPFLGRMVAYEGTLEISEPAHKTATQLVGV